MSFLRDSGGAAVLQILAAGLQFLAGVLVARGLGSDGKGIQALVVLIPDMARAVAHMGFGTACTRQIVKQPSRSGAIAGNLLVFALIVGSLFCAGLWVAFPWLERFVSADSAGAVAAMGDGVTGAIQLAILAVPLLLLEGYLGGALVGSRAILAANVAKVVQTGSFALLVPLLFHSQGVTVTVAVKAWVLSFALGDAVALFALLLVLRGRRRPDLGLAREAFLFGVKTLPTSISVYLLFRIDVALVRAWRTAEEVGVYAIAASLAMLFQIVGFSVERALVPRLMSKSGEETAVLTPIATRSFVLFGAPLAAVAALAAYPMVPLLFGEDFAGAVLPLAIILPGLVIGNVGQIANTDLLGRGFPGYASISATFALVVNIGLNVFLIPRYGINGAAIASLVCYTQHGLVLAYIYQRLAGVPMRELLIPKRDDLGRLLWMLRGGR